MSRFRNLPKVDVLAASEPLLSFPEKVRTRAARLVVERLRAEIADGGAPEISDAAAMAVEEARLLSSPSLRRVINASGVILHTGAGRARLAPAAVAQLVSVAGSHASVELDLETGQRGDRQAHVRAMLCELTGAEDAFVVNNNAAAVFLCLNAFAFGEEVVLSRGQMVEIGGSFRMPDIVRQSGCRLVEVGCTNKTRLRDYAEALSTETAAVLRCHPSNFKIIGFTEEPSIAELSGLCRESSETLSREVMLIDDVGSGCLVDTTRFGLPREPLISESLRAGADIVTSSGDKLLGGPQAGLIFGRERLIRRVRNHPLARALRVDKLTLAALEATLRAYAYGCAEEIPTVRYLSRPADEVRRMAKRLAAAFPGATVRPSVTEVGGGSIPGTGVETYCAVLPAERPDALSAALRKANPPVIGRVQEGAVWLDPRTMERDEVRETLTILQGLANGI